MTNTTRYTTELLDNVFTYTEAALDVVMTRTRPELYAEVRDVLKYKGASTLNKRDLAIIIVDAWIAEVDANVAGRELDQMMNPYRTHDVNTAHAEALNVQATRDAVAECDRVDAAPKLHECATRVTLTATRQHGEVLGHTFREDGVLLAHVELKNGVVRVLPENEFHTMTSHEMRFAMQMPASDFGVVTQGHADYCARNGHAIHKLGGRITSLCPRCGERSVTFHPERDNHAFVPFGDKVKCIGEHTGWIDAVDCAVKANEMIMTNADRAVARRDTIDQEQMIDVLRQIVDNGRDDLTWVLDRVDAAQCPIPDGRNSTIPRATGCPRCTDSVSPCDDCVLCWLVSLYNITGPVKLSTGRYFDLESDCYA